MKKSMGLFLIGIGLCHQAYSQPVLNVESYTIDENTANGTLVGQVSATGGGYTSTLQLDVGIRSASSWSTRGEDYEQIHFGSAFTTTPIVFSQIQSTGDYGVIYSIDTYSYTGKTSKKGYEILFRPRQKNASTIGFEGILETDLQIGGGSVVTSIDSVGGSETIGWLAVSAASEGIWSGFPFEATQTGSTVTEADATIGFTGPFSNTPNVLTSVATSNDVNQTGVGINQLSKSQIKVYMDELDDGAHAAEAVSLLMLQGSGVLTDTGGAVIGETGAVDISDTSRGNAPTISLSRSYTQPVVFVQPADDDIQDSAWRFTNIASNSFSGYLHYENESSLPSKYGNFKLNYVVLEAGSWAVGIENYTYAITGGNDSGAFTIDPRTGEIRVTDSTKLDYESGITQFDLAIEVTDGTGQVSTQTLMVSVNNVQDALNSDAQVIQGIASDDWNGWAVTGAGDVNGDGYDDVIVGVPLDDSNGTNAGRAYVLFGNGTGTLPDFSAVSAGNNGFMINGAGAGHRAGMAVGGGDINGDGLDDVVVGAPFASVNGGESGAAYVVFGKADTATVELSAIASSTDAGGFAIYGAYGKDHVGGSIVVGDVNGDGLADITLGEFSHKDHLGTDSVMSASWSTDNNLVYTVYGKADGELVNLTSIAASDNDGGFVVRASNRSVSSGFPFASSVLPVGDFNSDGLLDFVVNGDWYQKSNESNVLIFGHVGGDLVYNNQLANGDVGINLSPESGTYGFDTVNGANSYPGFTTAAVGDVNADGLDDIALMAVDSGCCSSIQYPTGYIIFGTTDKATINLQDIAAGNGGFVIRNNASAKYHAKLDVVFGTIGGLGDINGDGYDDIAIGDPYADSNNGRIYVVYGKADTTAVNLSDVVAGSGGFYTSGNTGDGLGHWIGRARDVNGDGIADALFGAPEADNSALNNAGAFYLMLGQGDNVTHWGTAGDDAISGTSNWPDSIAAGAGNDTINGYGGADVIYAGPGDDAIVISDTDFVRIDGGTGTDTLQLEGANLFLNLAAASSRVRSVEIIDIRGTGANALSFNKSISGTTQVMVKGDADDKVYSTSQQWVSSGETAMVDGVTYEVYSAGTARLLLQSGVSIATNAAPTIANQSFQVDEYTVGGTSLGTIAADANDVGDSVSFAVLSGNEKGFFSVDGTTGELTISDSVSRLDYESGATYSLTVQVTDSFGENVQAVVTINVNDLSTITHSVAMDASGGGSIWADWSSLMAVLGQDNTLTKTSTYDLGAVPGLPIDSEVMDLSMAGNLSILTELEFNGGTVEANLPVDFSVSYPDEVQPGGRIEVVTSLALKDGAKFTATSPSFRAEAKLSLSDYDFSVGTELPAYISSEIGGFNERISGDYASYSESISSSSGTATGTAVSGNSLRLEGQISLPEWVDEVVYTPSDWDELAMSLSGEKEGCKDEFFASSNGDDLYYKMKYSVLESYLWATADLHQTFSIELIPTAVLTLEDGTKHTFDPRTSLIMTPDAANDSNGDGIIEASLSVTLNPVFTNDTVLNAGVRVPFKTAQASYNIQEATCTPTNVYFYGAQGSVYKKGSYGSLLDEQFEFTVGDLVQDAFSYSLSDITYTEKLSFDLCDGTGTACAAALNTPPEASSVMVAGAPREGYTLSGSYEYSDVDGDAESGSTYQWNMAPDLAGTTVTTLGTGSSYALGQGVGGNYLQFCVIPSDGTESGSRACSGWVYVEGQEASLLNAGFHKALYLNGTNQYARVPLNGTFNPATTSFTVETWVKVDALGGMNRHIFQQLDSSGPGRTLLGLYRDGQIFSWLGNSGTYSSTRLTVDTWYHIALTYDATTSTVRMYLNGELEAETLKNAEASYGDIVLGPNKLLSGDWLEGALDETRVWTDARSQEQIRQHMNLAVSPSEPNLLFYYNYDQDNSDTLTDRTANYYNATLYNSPGYIYSTDNSLSFDGNGDYIQVANDPQLEFGTGDFSVEAWVYADPNSTGSYRNIVGKKLGGYAKAGWLLRLDWIDSKLRPGFFLADGSQALWVIDANEITRGTWIHLAGTVDRSTNTATLYVNGQAVKSGSTANIASVNAATVLRIGAWSTINHSYWKGGIDEVRIWNKTLTQAEIASNMQKRFDTPPANLAAYYTFENGKADDMSGNGHDGFLAGDTAPARRGIAVATRGSAVLSGVLPIGGGEMCRIDTGPAYGSVTLDENSGEFIYTPDDAYYIGSDSFSYYILGSDGSYSHSEKVGVTVE
ncbi:MULTISPECIES: LamG-like jellyroll fold domain-containing protein [unclassified Microbulbifer]|uniref:LamG-like jellyroll fold domain-containing protein n=1 Tax=unclassified Microbulbifer TaxID=2619833 RepID=UPI0027E3F210|nr:MULTISPECIES: LamG-like jellyroll fold domain-containing protein [unclassified Microbulbifer]